MIIPKFETISFVALESFYTDAYNNCYIDHDQEDKIAKVFTKLIKNRPRYRAVQEETGVPWLWIAAIHNLEGSCNFNTYLHNGDPLGKKTTHVPIGVGPFDTWEESAIDVIQKSRLNKIIDWSPSRKLYEAERMNGWGYMKMQKPSPYVWACTKYYEKGKYSSDGVYDPELVSKQVGMAAILMF